jgi:Asp-tRNA(Asn)/Glu-tRNA(Gln) amidotransferase C subunit
MSSDEHDWCWARIADAQQGTLTDGELDRFKAHLETCVECSSQLEEIDPVEVPEDERPEPRDRVLRAKRFIPSLRPPSNVMRGVLAGAAVVFLGIVGYVIEEFDLVTEPPPAEAPEPTLVLSSPRGAVEVERPREVFERKGIAKEDAFPLPLDEPMIFFPAARESDHNESDDGENFHQMKGDS